MGYTNKPVFDPDGCFDDRSIHQSALEHRMFMRPVVPSLLSGARPVESATAPILLEGNRGEVRAEQRSFATEFSRLRPVDPLRKFAAVEPNRARLLAGRL